MSVSARCGLQVALLAGSTTGWVRDADGLRTWHRAFSRMVSVRSCSGCTRHRLCGSARPTTVGCTSSGLQQKGRSVCSVAAFWWRPGAREPATLQRTRGCAQTPLLPAVDLTDTLTQQHTSATIHMNLLKTNNAQVQRYSPGAAIAAVASRGQALFVCDTPARAQHVAGGHEGRVRRALCDSKKQEASSCHCQRLVAEHPGSASQYGVAVTESRIDRVYATVCYCRRWSLCESVHPRRACKALYQFSCCSPLPSGEV